MSTIQAGAAMLLYMFTGTLLILLNKHALTAVDFPYPITLCLSGCVSSSLVACVAVWTGASKLQHKESMSRSVYMRCVMPLSFATGAAMVTGNVVYLYLSVSFIQMLKACTPVFIMAALFAAGMKKPTTKLIASIAIITTGTCIASYGEVNFNVVGVLVMVLSNVLNSAQLVLQQVLFSDMKFGIVEGLYYTGPASCFWMTCAAALLEFPAIVETGAMSKFAEYPWTFAGAAFLGLGVTVAGYLVIQYTNSLTLKILANFRSIAIIAISAVFFGEHVTPLEIFGYGVSLVGFALYTVSERQVPPALKDAAKKGQ